MGTLELVIDASFRDWLIRRYADELNQAGHLARLVEADPAFPADPTWAQVCDWVNGFPGAGGAMVLEWFDELRKWHAAWQRQMAV